MTGLVAATEAVALTELGRVHFAGIGGAGMSGIARVMLARGIPVSGSDAAASATLDALAAGGARVHVGHAADHLGDADTLVVSSAIRDDNPELAEARRRGLRVLHRAAALASLAIGRRVIAVTGTHGKTSTTSMITTVLLGVGADPGYVIGGVLAAAGVSAADGAGKDFVVEADESDGSFLMLSPDAAVVTNVEADHLDNYGTVEAYRASFAAFLGRISPGGLLVACADDPGARELAGQGAALGLRVRTYGQSPDADYQVSEIRVAGMRTTFEMLAAQPSRQARQASRGPGSLPGADGGTDGPFSKNPYPLTLPPLILSPLILSVGVPGRHYALNGAAAFAVAVELGIAAEDAAAALAGYRGAARRMEPKGEAGGVRVLDTYAHHPTELAADLRAAREIAGDGRVIAVFQPHLYSRTRIFAAEFGAALGLADEVIVLDVYAAREDPEPGVSGRLVADAAGPAARYVPDFADAPRVVASVARPGDLILTMGAGDVTRLGPLVLAEIAGPSSPASGGRPGR